MSKPREFFLGISEGNKPHVSDTRVWSTDYHLIEKKHADKLAEALETVRDIFKAMTDRYNVYTLDEDRMDKIAQKALVEYRCKK